VGLFGASILGPMILTAALSLGGIIWAAHFYIGIAVGVRYTGITWRELRVDVGAGIVYSGLLALISLGLF
jgi:hypothetical protein